MPRTFVITNTGGRVSADDARTMIQAARQQLVRVCAAHRREVPTLYYVDDLPPTITPDDTIDLGDQPPTDEQGVLGEHTEAGDLPQGTVYAGYELDNGGTVLTQPPGGAASVASIFTHELIEELLNADVNLVALGPFTGPDGTTYDATFLEGCDAIEGYFEVENAWGVDVYVSDWLKPAWFDPQYSGTDVCGSGQLQSARTLASGGYANFFNIQGPDAGNIHTVFGAKMPEYKKRLRLATSKSKFGTMVGPWVTATP